MRCLHKMAENQKMMQQIEQKGAEAGDEAAESEPEPGPTGRQIDADGWKRIVDGDLAAGEEGTPKKRFAGAPTGTATSPVAWAENKEGEGDETDVMDAAVLARMLNAGATDEPEEEDEEEDEEEGAIPREWLLRANRIQKQHEAGQFELNPRLGVECSFQMALAALRQVRARG